MSDAPPPPTDEDRHRERDRDRGPPRRDRSRDRDLDRRDRDYDRRDRDNDRDERSRSRRGDSRDRGDRRREDDRRPTDRGDFRRSGSGRSRSPRDDSPPRRRRRGWDDMGANPENAALLLQQQAAFANMHTLPTTALAGSKKQRELYIGNLPPTANEHMLKELFAHLVSACDGFNPALGPPVLNAQMAGGGQFAFVEFRDEQLAETAMLFNGIDLAGRQLKIGHPNGYLTPAQPVLVLKPPTELLAKFGVSQGAGAAAVDRPGGVSQETKKQRELYIGNLAVGMVTPPMLKELFTLPLEKLSAGGLPPVMEARVDANGKFAFVEFSSEELCTTALTLFNGMELCGREMKIARPAGYVAPAGGAPGIPGLLPPLPPGLPPAPPPGFPPSLPPGLPPLLAPIPAGGPPPALSSMAALGALAVADRPIPTRELRLTNLLSAAVLADAAEYEECVEDIKGAVEEHGAVAAFHCPKEGEPDAGTCFVRYEQIASAVKAYEALNGRDFDGNTVHASFLPHGTILG